MHISYAFSLARRRKHPQSRVISMCFYQGPDQVPEEILWFTYF